MRRAFPPLLPWVARDARAISASSLAAFVVALVLSTAIATELAAQGSPSAILEGQIVDSISGDPIAGVLVRMDTGPETFTDERGRFRLIGLTPGRHLFAMLSADCRITWGQVDLVDGVEREAQLRLPPSFGAAAEEARRRESERRRVQGRVLVAAEIDRMHARSVSELVRRLAPDMVASAGTGQIGARSRITGRGQASFMPDPGPVLVVDGARVGDVARALDYMHPSEVAVLEVLPGAAAGWEFGSDGGSGVIRVTTRKGLATGAPDEQAAADCVVPDFPVGDETPRGSVHEDAGGP
jgi:hypothetical protein